MLFLAEIEEQLVEFMDLIYQLPGLRRMNFPYNRELMPNSNRFRRYLRLVSGLDSAQVRSQNTKTLRPSQ